MTAQPTNSIYNWNLGPSVFSTASNLLPNNADTNGAPQQFDAWATDPANTYFPGNSASGDYQNLPIPTAISSRYMVYYAQTSNQNQLEANDVFLTNSQAMALGLNGNPSGTPTITAPGTYTNPAETHITLASSLTTSLATNQTIMRGGSPVNFTAGSTVTLLSGDVITVNASVQSLNEGDGSTTMTITDQALDDALGNPMTFQVNGPTPATGTNPTTVVNTVGNPYVSSRNVIPTSITVYAPSAPYSIASLETLADVSGTGLNVSSSIGVSTATLQDINKGMAGSTGSRDIIVTWTAGTATTTSMVTIVPDGTQIIDNSAILSSQNATEATSLAHLITDQAAIAQLTQVTVTVAGNTNTDPPPITSGQLHRGNTSTNLTSGAAVVQAFQTAQKNDIITVNYQYYTPWTFKDSKGILSYIPNDQTGTQTAPSVVGKVLIGGGHKITTSSNISIIDNVLSFANVPTDISFGTTAVSSGTVSPVGQTNGALSVSDTHTTSPGWEVGVQLTTPLKDVENNDLSGYMTLNNLPLSAQGLTPIASATASSFDQTAGITSMPTLYFPSLNSPTKTAVNPAAITAQSVGAITYGILFNISNYWAAPQLVNLPTKVQKTNSGYTGQLTWSLYNSPTSIQ
jgi:hypothetical protein